MEIREYTRDEFNKFIEQNNFESFNSNQVDAFSHDVVEKSKKGELNEFETYCAAAEYAMLEKAIVVENDLTKSLVYYRPTQVETVEIPDGIFKSINDKSSLRYKETSLNILKGIAGINCADEDAIEKAKALPIGTEKTYGGKLYIKTAQGWRLKAKGTRNATKQEVSETSMSETSDNSSKEKKVPSKVTIDQKTFRIKDGKISASKFDTPSQINKLNKFAKEKGLKIEWLEDKNTPEAQAKRIEGETKDYIYKYNQALRKTINLEKQLFDAEEKSKDNNGKDFFILPLDKLKKTEWYRNQLDKIKESKEDFDKIKSEIPKELDKQVLERQLKTFEDGKDYFENRVNRFKEQGYDKSEKLQEKLLWREANDDLKERKIYREHLDDLLKKVN